jgi:hypothetical protein
MPTLRLRDEVEGTGRDFADGRKMVVHICALRVDLITQHDCWPL